MLLGPIPQAAQTLYSLALREALAIPSDERIVATVALAFEKAEAAANTFWVSRDELEDNVRLLY
ncbi:hypothetical protein [Citricoccus nitrophenolicus]|uniref:hypothetical protein n=1 Tax=Citricoccus nitrophenolicus TaxID=863575 RepID=UPI0039B6B03E